MKKTIICILGPTSSGKTKTAIELAKKIKAEIISSDSMQIYKEMPILSQSPSQKQLKKAKHHLIGEVSVKKEYSAAQFSQKSKKAINRIIKKNKIPIVTGGTGLYVKVLLDGLFPAPQKDEGLRKRLYAEAEKNGSKALYEKLQQFDAESAQRIHPNDLKRVIRAIELFYQTGVAKSVHMKKTKGIREKYNVIESGIMIKRSSLYKKIDKAVDVMFDGGLIEEVKKILKMNPSKTAYQAIGIKEITGYLHREYDIGQARELMKKNTRRYAKRQLTWFRANKNIKWFKDGKSLISYCITKKRKKQLDASRKG